MRALMLSMLAIACGAPATQTSHPTLGAAEATSTCANAPRAPADLPGTPNWCIELKVPTGSRWFFSAPKFNLLTDGAGKELYRYEMQKPRGDASPVDPHAADLDGDGVDELIYQRSDTDEASRITLVYLEVVSFQDPADPHADQIQIGGKGGSESCKATWKLVDRAGGGKHLEVTGDCEHVAGAADPVHTITYRLTGASLEREP